MSTAAAEFGELLRRWRRCRQVSQLDLAFAASVSQRHLSFIEVGRSQPSRDMVLRLAHALNLPLRDRNALLLAAGYAPVYPEHDLDDAELAQVKHVLEVIVRAHQPYPAYVIDRAWNLVLANDAATALTSLVADPNRAAAAANGNVLRLLLHPDALQPHVVDFERVAASMLRRVELECAHAPNDDRLAALLQEARSLLAGRDLQTLPAAPAPDELLVPLHLRFEQVQLRLFTTVATIGAAHDITLEELRIESLLPMDRDTDATLRWLGGSAVDEEAHRGRQPW